MALSHSRFMSRELSLLIIPSALGGAASVPIGHLGSFLKTVPGIPFGSSQTLSGLHVLWIVLSEVLVRKIGSGTMIGVLKCLVEAFLLSYHGIFVLLISSIEGVIVDVVLTVLKQVNTPSI